MCRASGKRSKRTWADTLVRPGHPHRSHVSLRGGQVPPNQRATTTRTRTKARDFHECHRGVAQLCLPRQPPSPGHHGRPRVDWTQLYPRISAERELAQGVELQWPSPLGSSLPTVARPGIILERPLEQRRPRVPPALAFHLIGSQVGRRRRIASRLQRSRQSSEREGCWRKGFCLPGCQNRPNRLQPRGLWPPGRGSVDVLVQVTESLLTTICRKGPPRTL